MVVAVFRGAGRVEFVRTFGPLVVSEGNLCPTLGRLVEGWESGIQTLALDGAPVDGDMSSCESHSNHCTVAADLFYPTLDLLFLSPEPVNLSSTITPTARVISFNVSFAKSGPFVGPYFSLSHNLDMRVGGLLLVPLHLVLKPFDAVGDSR
ncbi:NAD(P)H-quinone oxidoreductase subunit K [Striga asiatica]|uniref:NAD(P)H-quinone oxidoreductase subunit K n=1 Tax=Striga asiatica TaxID=4170 RepID=A0A5A7R648_STRAF|nr:NAD(P)H-quinone oxidoreductase subunit K [Striga asiatica]